jgi:nucleolar MIF4G domain-containing protein 1
MISNKANLLDSFVVLYATLVGALHRVIGMEFGRSSAESHPGLMTLGAHFVHTLVMRYNSLVNSPTASTAVLQATIYETPDASKEALNLLVLIAELYNAQVVSSKLVYDYIRGFLNTKSDEGEGIMTESAVEGLLKILRCP